jgi:putative oxygen-independent coproporphyrinogen III oxidase
VSAPRRGETEEARRPRLAAADTADAGSHRAEAPRALAWAPTDPGEAPSDPGEAPRDPADLARPRPPRGLYIHIPFCRSLCPYCDFVVYTGLRPGDRRLGAFLEALATELELRAAELDAQWGPPGSAGRPPLETLYVGGGTPSLLTADALAALVATVERRYGLARDAEITLEVNPGPGERGDPAAWRRVGVTRLSIGAQSLQADELRRLGRRHRPEDVAEAVEEARAAGIPSLNLDLLYDIPGQSLTSWLSTLEAALALGPDHLSLYALTLDDPEAEGLTGPLGDHLPTRRGARRWREAARRLQDEDRAAAMYHAAAVRLGDAGWFGYEISSWARPGHPSRHNLLYWTRQPYEAVGPGAHAFDGRVRRWNAASLEGYLAALRPGWGIPPRLPPGGGEVVEGRAAWAEWLILRLRTSLGVPDWAARRPPFRSVLPWARAAGLVASTPDGRIVLTLRGRLLSNELFARLV